MPGRSRLVSLALALLILPLGSGWLPTPAQASAVTDTVAELPGPRAGTASVWTGEQVYIFGGDPPGQVFRFDPETGVVETLTGLVPTRIFASAVWDARATPGCPEGCAYVFGGWTGGSSSLDTILRYDPASGGLHVMAARFPFPTDGTSAVWAGDHAFIFGGGAGGSIRGEIFRFDPVADTLEAVGHLPTSRKWTSAVWSGESAYVFGGIGPSSGTSQSGIVRFDPITGDVRTVGTLPGARDGTAAVWDGSRALVFGGRDRMPDGSTVIRHEILGVDVTTGAVTVLDMRLVDPLWAPSGVWTGQVAYVLGGATSSGATALIQKMDPAAIGLQFQRGPGAFDIAVSWIPVKDADAHRVYRAAIGGDEVLIAEVGDVGTVADTVADCTKTYRYRIVAVDNGEEMGNGRFGVTDPDPLLEALCLANTYPFYWGPVPNDNTAGPGEPPLWSLEAIDQRQDQEGSGYPLWHATKPGRFQCCQPVQWDANTLEGPPDWDFDVLQELGDLLGTDLGEDVGEELEKWGIVVDTSGMQFRHKPFLDPDIGGRAAFKGVSSVTAGLLLNNTSYGAQGSSLFGVALDEGSDRLVKSDPNAIIASATFPGPSFDTERSFKANGRIPFLPGSPPFTLNGKVSLVVDGQISAKVGTRLQTEGLQPELLEVGAGAGFDLGGTVKGEGSVGCGSIAFQAGVSGSAGIKTELMLPLLEGPAADEPIISDYTGLTYYGLTLPTFVLKAEPTSFDTEEPRLRFQCGFFDFPFRLPMPEILQDQGWEGGAVAFGPARLDPHEDIAVRTIDPFALAATSPAVAGAPVEVPADQQVVVLSLEGEPGAEGSLRIERPVVHFQADGSMAVREWVHDTPSVTLGVDGRAVLVLDSTSVQKALSSATRGGLGYDTALGRLRDALDLDGDGLADAVNGLAGDARAPTVLEVAWEGPEDAPRHLFVGEPLRVHVSVLDALSGQPVPGGTVTVHRGSEPLGSAPVVDGAATIEAFVPVGHQDAQIELVTKYGGTTEARASQALHYAPVRDRPPVVDILSPDALGVVIVDRTDTVPLRFTTGDAQDVNASTARARFAEGAWSPAEVREDGTFVADLRLPPIQGKPDGLRQIDVKVSDGAGHVGIGNTTVRLGTTPPRVQIDADPAIVLGSSYALRWEADEAVAVRVVLEPLASEQDNITGTNDWYAATGEIILENLTTGAYRVHLDVLDVTDVAPAELTRLAVPNVVFVLDPGMPAP